MTSDARRSVGLKESQGKWRLLGPALVCWAATAALIHVPGASASVALCAGVVGFVASGFLWARGLHQRGVRPSHGAERPTVIVALGMVLVTCAALTLLGARINVIEHAREVPAVGTTLEAGKKRTLGIVLAGYPQVTQGLDGEARGWAHAKLEAVDGVRLPERVNVMLWLPTQAEPHWGVGTRLEVAGTMKASSPESRAAYEVSVREMREAARGAHAGNAFAWLTQLPPMLRTQLAAAAAAEPGARLVPGLAVGDTSLVDDALQSLMLESSLTHLVAVSGSNCALVIAAAVAASSRLGAGRRTRIVISAAALCGFVVIVGPDASVQRASVMAGVLLISNFSGKSRQALPSLGLAVLVLLVQDPWQAIQPGFALSVAATAGILLGVAPLERLLRVRLRLPKLIALPVAVACIAQFACAPLLLLLQPGIPVAGVAANILAAPAAPAGTALGLAAMLMLPLHTGLGEACVWLAMWPARWIEASGALGVSLPLGRWFWPGGWSGSILLFAVEALLISLWMSGGRVFAPWRSAVCRPTSQVAVLRVIAGVTAGLIAAVVLVVPVTVRSGVPANWFMVACDVDQGDAILLRDPAHPHSVMLVDVGDDAAQLNACLGLFGVQKIDLLVLTHDHQDHVGAVRTVLPRVRQVLVAPAAKEHEDDRPLLTSLARAGAKFTVGQRGMHGGSDSGLRWVVLGPEPGVAFDDINATSLVLLVETSGVRVALLGDTREREQRWLAREYPGLRADVVKVAHHGSRDQSLAFYRQLEARSAVIPVGKNRYGHPNKTLVEHLVSSGTSVFRTDELGSVALSIEAQSIEAQSAEVRGPDPHAGKAQNPEVAQTITPWAAGERSLVGTGLNVWGNG